MRNSPRSAGIESTCPIRRRGRLLDLTAPSSSSRTPLARSLQSCERAICVHESRQHGRRKLCRVLRQLRPFVWREPDHRPRQRRSQTQWREASTTTPCPNLAGSGGEPGDDAGLKLRADSGRRIRPSRPCGRQELAIRRRGQDLIVLGESLLDRANIVGDPLRLPYQFTDPVKISLDRGQRKVRKLREIAGLIHEAERLISGGSESGC